MGTLLPKAGDVGYPQCRTLNLSNPTSCSFLARTHLCTSRASAAASRSRTQRREGPIVHLRASGTPTRSSATFARQLGQRCGGEGRPASTCTRRFSARRTDGLRVCRSIDGGLPGAPQQSGGNDRRPGWTAARIGYISGINDGTKSVPVHYFFSSQ